MEAVVSQLFSAVLDGASGSGVANGDVLSSAARSALESAGGAAAVARALWRSSPLARWIESSQQVYQRALAVADPQPGLSSVLSSLRACEYPSKEAVAQAKDEIGLFHPASAVVEAADRQLRTRSECEAAWLRRIGSAAPEKHARAAASLLAASEQALVCEASHDPLRSLIQSHYAALLSYKEIQQITGEQGLEIIREGAAGRGLLGDAIGHGPAVPVDALVGAARWALANLVRVEVGDVRGAADTPLGVAKFFLTGIALRGVAVHERDVHLTWDPKTRIAEASVLNFSASLARFHWAFEIAGGVVGDSGYATASVTGGEASIKMELGVDGDRRPHMGLRGVRVVLGRVEIHIDGTLAAESYNKVLARFADKIDEEVRDNASKSASGVAEQLVTALNEAAKEYLPPIECEAAESLCAQSASDLRNWFDSGEFY